MPWQSKITVSIIVMFALASLSRALRNHRIANSVVSISRSYRAASQVRRRKKDNDYIEAEIVGEENKKNPLSSWMGGTSFLSGEKKEGGGIFNKLAKVFGQDEESKRKKEQKKAINTAIDKIFEVHRR